MVQLNIQQFQVQWVEMEVQAVVVVMDQVPLEALEIYLAFLPLKDLMEEQELLVDLVMLVVVAAVQELLEQMQWLQVVLE